MLLLMGLVRSTRCPGINYVLSGSSWTLKDSTSSVLAAALVQNDENCRERIPPPCSPLHSLSGLHTRIVSCSMLG